VHEHLADPAVSTGRMLQAEALTVSGKAYAFVGNEDRLIVKVPRDLAVEWVENGKAEFVVLGKRTLKEWVALPYAPDAGPVWTDAIGRAKAYVASVT